jgi:putative nucleotidyltransferase with HDIG domain
MSEPIRFLSSMTQALAQMSLYADGHPARDRAIDTAYSFLLLLQEADPRPRFTFLGPQAIYGDSPIRELREWEWGARLANAGVQRLELERGTRFEEFEAFLEEVVARLTVQAAEQTSRRITGPQTTIRYGLAGVKGTETEKPPEPMVSATLSFQYSLREEVDTMAWLQDEVRSHGALPLAEAEAVVRSLSLAMRAEGGVSLPMAELAGFDQYGTTHAMNVSVLAMALGEWMELSAKDVRALGVAALLHDIGMTRIAPELLATAGPLTPAERAIVEGHAAAGAAVIYEADKELDLAATVAYEHHLGADGSGYPVLRHRRDPHPASALVRVCDVYDALRSVRPHRAAWTAADALGYIEERAGGDFDQVVGQAFVAMMRSWEARVAVIDTVETA